MSSSRAPLAWCGVVLWFALACRAHDREAQPLLAAQGSPVFAGGDPGAVRPGFQPHDSGNGDDVAISAAPYSVVENSIAVHPSDPRILLCGHNAFDDRRTGLHIGWSRDGGATWDGFVANDAKADPATAIDRDGTFYVAYVKKPDVTGAGLGLRVSRDLGVTWTALTVQSNTIDKNHIVVDTGAASPFIGRLYAGWTRFRGGESSDILVSASADGGRSWSNVRNVSGASVVNKQGVNLQTGPNGELYCCWAEFGESFDDGEVAIGFNLSLDGGSSFLGPRWVHADLRGSFPFTLPNAPEFKINSFPSMAVDKSGGVRNGWIYVFWTNIGEPGVNEGDLDIYMARSRDGGFSWDAPLRVNDDATTNAQWQVWSTCDPANGDLHALFFDRREDPADVLARAWVARSTDGGTTWINLPVGDTQFDPGGTPSTRGLLFLGDYLGIAASGGRVWPLWSDSRQELIQGYTSRLAFDIEGPRVRCPEPRVVEASAQGGSLATDRAVAAFLAAPAALDEFDPAPEVRSDAPDFFPLGTTELAFVATDDAGNSTECRTALTVVDSTPPGFELSLAPQVLAPADHRMVAVDVTATVSDLVDPHATFTLVTIDSNDPDSGLGPLDLPKDIQGAELGTPDTRFFLRAERGPRRGRLYTIKYAATDVSGNSSPRVLQVQVD